MYPVLYMRITQGYMMGSHKGYYAVDDGCSDTAKDYMVAPFSGTVKQIYPQYENQVFFESDNPVLFADGTKDYATVMFSHQDSPMSYGMTIGKHYNQGEKIYVEGGRYAGKNGAIATHVHLEFARGKYTGWHKNEYGYYCINNGKKPEECCFIDNNYHILYNYGYNFKKVEALDEYTTGNYITLFNMNVRSGAGTDKAILKVKDLTEDGQAHATSKRANDVAVYKEKTVFTAKEIINKDSSVWAKSPSGYICIKDSSQIYCEKLN